MKTKLYSFLDQVLINMEQGLKTISGVIDNAKRENPAQEILDVELNDQEREKIIGLMRVNHAGEVAAQALYQGQSLTAKTSEVQSKLQQAADEEADHLAWCQNRVIELGGHISYLSPFWYLGSLGIGVVAGILGDKWSLGFLAETEYQVVAHLNKHLRLLPEKDYKSRAIVLQMKEDEAKHAMTANEAGAVDLPFPIRKIMQGMSMVMTTTAYYI